MSLRIAFIGCVRSSLVALETLLHLPLNLSQVAVVMTRRTSSYNSDFVDLTPVATARDVPLLYVEDLPSDAEQAAALRAWRPDLIVCVGWSKLLGDDVLGTAPLGVVGFHPAALPANRGRHPLIWALALGLPDTASSFFLMQSEADSGPLLNQRTILISDEDDAAALYDKVLAVVPDQLRAIVKGLNDNSLVPVLQDNARTNNWRKRSARDGLVDWRMDATSIYNLVRALTHPYPGAHFMYRDAPIKLWKCTIEDTGAQNLEPGKVIAVDGSIVTVKCGHGSLRLLEHELAQLPALGSYI